jgi:hypothetical protein
MPPRLKLNNAATVTPEFIMLVQELYAEWLRKYDNLIRRGIANPRQASVSHFAYTARRMLPIVHGKSPAPRVGLDYEITRFTLIPYTEFDVVEGPHPSRHQSGRIRWLVGRTRHVTATYYNRRSEIAGQLGKYDVYIPETIIQHPDLDQLHMIPLRNTRSKARHYHHGIMCQGAPQGQPLNYPTHNCWGDYTGPIKSLMDEPDFPELFRQIYNHLSTYGDRPPYTQLDFDVRTPEAR